MATIKELEDIGVDMTNAIYLPGEVYSSKNSNRITFNYALKRRIIIGSEAVERYKLTHIRQYQKGRAEFQRMIEGYTPPYFLTFCFIRKTKGKWDFSNLVQLPQDMMQKYKWLTGDDVSMMFPLPPLEGPPYFQNKELCGLVISLHDEFNKKNKVQP